MVMMILSQNRMSLNLKRFENLLVLEIQITSIDSEDNEDFENDMFTSEKYKKNKNRTDNVTL